MNARNWGLANAHLLELPPWGLGAALLVMNLSGVIKCSTPSYCVADYWYHFWLVGYSDGLLRRAALGELFPRIVGDPVDALTLSVTAIVVVVSMLVLTGTRYLRSHGHRAPVVFVLVFAGPLPALCFEVLGDPLQAALLLALLFVLVQPRIPRPLRGASVLLVATMVLLVHEAAAFLIVPFLYAAHCQLEGRSPHLVTAGALACVAASVAVAAGFAQSLEGSGAGLLLRDESVVHAPPHGLPSFVALLQDELTTRLGSLRAVVRTLGLFPRVALWPVAVVVTCFILARDTALPRNFGLLSAASLPLYVIAHDWGRFSVYTLMLALALSSVGSAPPPASNPLRALPAAALQRLLVSAGVVLVATRAHAQYRVNGLDLTDFFYLCTALLAINLLLPPTLFTRMAEMGVLAGGPREPQPD